MNDDYILIATFTQPEEAHLAAGRLEAEEIDYFLNNQNIVQMNVLLSNAVGGVQLFVHKDHVEQAMQALSIKPPEAPTSGAEKCPSCGSTEIGPGASNKWTKFLFLFAGIPLPFFKRAWRCSKCQHQWK